MWDPLRDLDRLLSRMHSTAGSSFFATSSRGSWVPAMDFIEKEDCYKIFADLPGMDRNDITVDIEGSRLCIGGNRKSLLKEDEMQHAVMLERGSGRFERCVQLPSRVAEDGVQATLRNSVLVVNVKKVGNSLADRSGISVKIG